MNDEKKSPVAESRAVGPRSLVAMAHVASVPRSIEFYGKLGFELRNTHAPQSGAEPVWAFLESGHAMLMVSKADGPFEAAQQAVLFYVYFDDVDGTHARLARAGIEVGPIRYPFYCPRGEFRVIDPDGYVLMVAHT